MSFNLIKTFYEHGSGQYIKISDSECTFNALVQEVLISPLNQTHGFVDKAYFNEIQQDQIIFAIDIKKCRKNILYYG